jgi:tetratricopeptide (TPR) repeat protein
MAITNFCPDSSVLHFAQLRTEKRIFWLFSLGRCVVGMRYERTPLGKGHLRQNDVIKHGCGTRTPGLRIVEYEDIARFAEEADHLMALQRYQEAEKLLEPYFIPEVLEEFKEWFYLHSSAVNYAVCLLQIGRVQESVSIFEKLDACNDKPDVFYVNYSLALLKAGRWEAAEEVCRRGLLHFPEDLGILGNHTIALRCCGQLDAAQDSARKRISLRRDVHSIEEAVAVLFSRARAHQYSNLPNAISDAKIAWDLIKEGLCLNPEFWSLRLTETDACKFAHDESKALDLWKAIYESDRCPAVYRRLAFEKMVDSLADGKHFQSALDMIQKMRDEQLSDGLVAIKMRILARHFMIGKIDSNGAHILIPEVRDYYLNGSSNAIIAAEILDWIGETNKGVSLLRKQLSLEPKNWDAIRTIAFLHVRANRPHEALKCAELLPQIAPWRAESYDVLSYVARAAANSKAADQAKILGDEVFAQEQAMFEELRTHFDRTPDK